jgi:2,4-dienoyl-CoA reductase-like NADH-dependent reductase (Old Yellow Enzyme family)
MSSDQNTLLAEVERFLAEHQMSPVTFGRSALNDPHFVRQLRNGRRVWPETESKVRAFMAGQLSDHAAPVTTGAAEPSGRNGGEVTPALGAVA